MESRPSGQEDSQQRDLKLCDDCCTIRCTKNYDYMGGEAIHKTTLYTGWTGVLQGQGAG